MNGRNDKHALIARCGGVWRRRHNILEKGVIVVRWLTARRGIAALIWILVTVIVSNHTGGKRRMLVTSAILRKRIGSVEGLSFNKTIPRHRAGKPSVNIPFPFCLVLIGVELGHGSGSAQIESASTKKSYIKRCHER